MWLTLNLETNDLHSFITTLRGDRNAGEQKQQTHFDLNLDSDQVKCYDGEKRMCRWCALLRYLIISLPMFLRVGDYNGKMRRIMDSNEFVCVTCMKSARNGFPNPISWLARAQCRIVRYLLIDWLTDWFSVPPSLLLTIIFNVLKCSLKNLRKSELLSFVKDSFCCKWTDGRPLLSVE